MASRFQFALPDPRPRDGWFRVGNIDITTTALLVAAGVASMFVYAINSAWLGRLDFFSILVRNGEFWRLVTWPIPNPPTRILVVLTLVFFWLIGHMIEELVGRVRYTVMIAIVTVVPAAIVTALPAETFVTGAFGLSLLLTTMFAVFAAENPHAPSFFGIPVWVLAAVFIGIDVLRIVGDRLWGSLVMLLASILLAFVAMRQWGFLERLSFIPNLAGAKKPHPPRRGPAPPRTSPRRPSSERRKSGQVVEGPWSAPAPPRSSAEVAAAQAELDLLLDKISASGLDSLTSDEKRRLNDLSKRLR